MDTLWTVLYPLPMVTVDTPAVHFDNPRETGSISIDRDAGTVTLTYGLEDLERSARLIWEDPGRELDGFDRLRLALANYVQERINGIRDAR